MITKFKLFENKNKFEIGDIVFVNFYDNEKLYLIVDYNDDESYICNFIGYYFDDDFSSWIDWEESEDTEIIKGKYLDSITNDFYEFFFNELDDSLANFIKNKFNIDLKKIYSMKKFNI